MPKFLFLEGIRRGLVVTIHTFQVCVCRFESPLDPQGNCPGRLINVPRCEGLSMVLQQLRDPLVSGMLFN